MIRRLESKSIAMIFILLSIALIYMWIRFTSTSDDVRFNNETAQILEGKWSVSWNGDTTITTAPGRVDASVGDTVKMSKVLDADDIQGNSLAFYVRQSWVEAYIDEELLLQSDEDRVVPFDMTPGSYWYFFRLPSDISGKTLTITIKPMVEKYAGELPTIYVGTKASIMYMILNQAKIPLLLVLPVLFLGLAMLLIGLLTKHMTTRKKLCGLGLFAICTSTWNLLESRITQLIWGDMVAASFLLFASLYLIPITAVSFMMTFETLKKRIYVRALFWISIAFFVVAQILQITNTVYYIDMVIVAHILLILVFSSVFISYIDIRRKHETIPDRSIYRAMMILGIFCSVDIAYYYIIPTAQVGRFTRVGLLAFFGYLGFSAIRHIGSLEIQRAEHRVYQKLAYKDIMTGLLNRTAFEEELERYRQEKWREETILLLVDMNRLKYINDNYGHAAGDKALIQIANILHQTFQDNCKCYRIGGDEFVVISRGISEGKFAYLCEVFKEAVKNSPQEDDWLLSAACGYCVVEYNDIDECYKTADTKMYEDKLAFKESLKELS